MKKIRFITFWFLILLSTATVTLDSYGQNNNSGGETTDLLTYDEGVVINGIKWATRNVDTPGTFVDKPEDWGMIYQWNRNIGWDFFNSQINTNNGGWDSSYPVGATWEKTNDVCPSGYRVPTDSELQSLVSAGSRWVILEGVNGRLFGSGDNVIFLPAAGCRHDSNGMLCSTTGSSGNYWSSTQWDKFFAYNLFFNRNKVEQSIFDRRFGQSVRCVAE